MSIQKDDISAEQYDAVLRVIHEVHESQRVATKKTGGSALSIEPDVMRAAATTLSRARSAGDEVMIRSINMLNAWHELVRHLNAPKPPPPRPAAVIGPLDTGYITFDGGTPVGGSSQLTLRQDGSYDFDGSFHDSGFPSYNDSFVWIVRDNLSQTAYTFRHAGHMAGTLESGSRDDSWSVSGRNDALQQGWEKFVFGWTWHWEAAVNWDVNSLLSDALAVVGTVLAVVAIV